MQIDSDVPLPTLSGRPPKYPFRDLKVGDSFYAEGISATVISNAAQQHKRTTGRTFKVRTVPGGSRCWRIS